MNSDQDKATLLEAILYITYSIRKGLAHFAIKV